MKILYKLNNKNIARAMFEDGQELLLYTNKANPHSEWLSPYRVSMELISNSIYNQSFRTIGFDRLVDTFEYFNCNHEMGYYTSFYIEVEVDSKRTVKY